MRFDIVTVKNTAWYAIGGWLIRKIEGTETSHCAIIVYTDNGPFVYESVFPKAKKTPLEDWGKHYKIINRWNYFLDQPHAGSALSWLNRHLTWYALFQLPLIGLSIVSRAFALFSRKINLQIDGNKFHVCSEYVGRWMQKFLDAKFSDPEDFISVKDVEDANRFINR